MLPNNPLPDNPPYAATCAHDLSIALPNVHATQALGEALANMTGEGDIIALFGALGAGKTTLVQAYCRTLGVLEEVSSPTFNLVHLYEGLLAGRNITLWHCDLYRLEHAQEALALGLEEAFGAAIMLIEWPERLGADLPEDALRIYLQADEADDVGRTALLRAGKPWQQRLERLKQIYAGCVII
jgi:tRNA threonylcarbamoyladenosine biosynthesis protein TsaE